ASRPTTEIVETGEEREVPIGNAVMRLALPIARVLAPLHRNATNRPAGQALQKKLVQAGKPFGMTVPEFLALRWVGMLVGFGLADRVDLTEIRSFVLALLQAEQLGASVAQTLRTMADQMRIKRWTLAEEMAGKVPVKLMAPLVIFIFPASFIVLFVPIYLRYQ